MKIKTLFTACLITAAGLTLASAETVSIADVKMLAKAGLNDEIILSHIRNAHASFRLSTAEIIELKDLGVSQTVIDYMINTAAAAPAPQAPSAPVQEVSAGTTAPAPAPVQEVTVGTAAPALIVEPIPAAPDPDFVWVGGGWTWRHTRLGFGYWEWAPGYWVRPPYRGAVWIGGGWRHRGWGEDRWH